MWFSVLHLGSNFIRSEPSCLQQQSIDLKQTKEKRWKKKKKKIVKMLTMTTTVIYIKEKGKKKKKKLVRTSKKINWT